MTRPLFEPSAKPRVFACPPGVDFPAEVVRGLRKRFEDQPPESIARASVYVNAGRMARRIKACFEESGASFLPRIRLITDIADDFPVPDLPPPVSDLRRRLELRQLVARRIAVSDGLAPASAIPDMADSLARLLDEMSEQNVTVEDLRAIDVAEHSEHWARSLEFLEIVGAFCGPSSQHMPGIAQRLRLAADQLEAKWQTTPVSHPVIIAGSTGSRGTTAKLMEIVARLPQGALILPGFDFAMPLSVWPRLFNEYGLPEEDHPQFRFAHLMKRLDIEPSDIEPWSGDVTGPQAARNRVVSLSLRPAPVTNQWMEEAPKIKDIADATRDMALIEAETPRAEAMGIAMVIRNALEDGRSVALITPDQTLTRLVTAALDRWSIVPDASIGERLHRTAPGRLMRQILALYARKLQMADLLALLKHPIVARSGDRRRHLDETRKLELWLRRKGQPNVSRAHLSGAAKIKKNPVDSDWLGWVSDVIFGTLWPEEAELETHIERHFAQASLLAKGADAEGSDAELWNTAAGQSLAALRQRLRAEAEFGGRMSRTDYAALIENLLKSTISQNPVESRGDVMIWGTLEARTQNADVTILGGLNDGTWPEPTPADPWMNRAMRLQAGLLLPERTIGLAAHDFQQAAAARSVYLTRSKRDAAAETVPSRWLNRFTNLMGGIPGGKAALEAMKTRGGDFLALAKELERPKQKPSPAQRPAPCPPVDKRPKLLSLTDIQTLIRDPYAVYAKRVLNLYPIDPLAPMPDARLRGTLLHKVVERSFDDFDPALSDEALIAQIQMHASAILADETGWPEVMALWQARFAKGIPTLVAGERARRAEADPIAKEREAHAVIPEVGIAIKCKADRIDRTLSGTAAIYDYKLSVKGPQEIERYEKQLWIEALILQQGAFDDLPPMETEKLGYIGLGSKFDSRDFPLTHDKIDAFRAELVTFLSSFQDPDHGYLSRRDPSDYAGDYDQLARYGEWDEATSDAAEASA